MRLFFAIWPDAMALQALLDLQGALLAECGGRAMRRDQLHMTLAFLGETPEARVPALKELLATLPAQFIAMRTDRLGSFMPPGIVWAGPSEPNGPLLALKEALDVGLGSAGFPVEARRFRPHITLLRDARRKPALRTLDIAWPVTTVTLVQSRQTPDGSHYDVIAARPLTTAPTGD